METDPLARRPVALTVLAWVLAVLASGSTFAYLDPPANGTWLHLAGAVVVLAVPIAARPPFALGRVLAIALVWACLGTVGAYAFGVPVLAAGLVLGLASVTGAALRRVRRSPRPGRSGTASSAPARR